MATLSINIVNNANLMLRAAELNIEHSRANVPNILIGNKDEK